MRWDGGEPGTATSSGVGKNLALRMTTSGWRRARTALGLHVCISAPSTNDARDSASPPSSSSPRSSPSPKSPSRFQLLRSSMRQSRNTCSICLEQMKPGIALFTAECSHTFHFSCIASNVRYGNLVCPVCRASWKEVPWQVPTKEEQPQRPRRLSTRQASLEGFNVVDEELRRLDPVLRILDESIASARGIRRTGTPERTAYDDDEPLNAAELDRTVGRQEGGKPDEGSSFLGDPSSDVIDGEFSDIKLEVTCEAEVDNVSHAEARDDFTVLVHVRALPNSSNPEVGQEELAAGMAQSPALHTGCRAPIDLVTVLDISGSMAGTKLLLLKQAMEFVIRNLSPSDRLSVVVFSSAAKRLFPLRRMVEDGRQLALRAIDSLVSTGGTNIAEGLRKGAQILEDRRERNPIASIMLLSDGQDTHSIGARSSSQLSRGGSFRRVVSSRYSMLYDNLRFPVHTFGFGADHDATTMHSIAEVSGGTFSFIQAEAAVQDAFAQCIGGLLSVVVQDVKLWFNTAGDKIKLRTVQAGSYEKSVTDEGFTGYVKLGDLYAEEERDVLLELSIPSLAAPATATKVLNVECSYREPVSRRVDRSRTKVLLINRPNLVDTEKQTVNIQVDRQRNRLRTAQSIEEAGSLADRGDLTGAQQALQTAKVALRNSTASQAGDSLSSALESELTEIQVRMANRQMYERSGRAYVLSAQSSHFRQRATTRGDNVESQSRDYQTPSMVDMVLKSQTLSLPSAAGETSSRERNLSRKASRNSAAT